MTLPHGAAFSPDSSSLLPSEISPKISLLSFPTKAHFSDVCLVSLNFNSDLFLRVSQDSNTETRKGHALKEPEHRPKGQS